MQVLLSALGWTDEDPVGNRLRWSIAHEHVEDGTYLGLPDRVILERAEIDPDPIDTSSFILSSSWSVPQDWWNSQGNVDIENKTPARLVLPETVQAMRFSYQGPDTLMRAFSPSGELLLTRKLPTIQPVLLETAGIAVLEFLVGGGSLINLRTLNLFAGHDAGLDFKRLATLNPRATTAMDLNTVERRLFADSGIDEEDWVEFQQVIVAGAVASSPDVPPANPDDPSFWQQFQAMLAVRWRYSILYGLGFLDGPDAGNGTKADDIAKKQLLKTMSPKALVYRVHCRFSDDLTVTSNPIVIQPMLLAPPLWPPHDIAYDKARVRLFEPDEYRLDAELTMGSHDSRVVGMEIEEILGASPILGHKATPQDYIFQSWRPPDHNGQMSLLRAATVPFYDVSISCRARSLDGWDRVSEWSEFTPEVLPVFDHSPEAPPLRDAQLANSEVTLFAKTANGKFDTWQPDHAARNTPGSVLKVMRKAKEPESTTVTIQPATVLQTDDGEQVEVYRAGIFPALADPDRFVDGYIIGPKFRAAIRAITTHELDFAPIADAAGTTAMPGAGQVTLQQAPGHDDLFGQVASFPIDNFPDRLTFADDLPKPADAVEVSHYAVKVDMGIVAGGLSNSVGVLREPDAPAVPPPFSVELMGVDFYNRTMVRIRLTEATPGSFTVYWADGVHDASGFGEAAVEGDFGPQAAHEHRHLFERFTMPVPQGIARQVTIGVQAKTGGGYRSPFSVQQVALPVYGA